MGGPRADVDAQVFDFNGETRLETDAIALRGRAPRRPGRTQGEEEGGERGGSSSAAERRVEWSDGEEEDQGVRVQASAS